eukprot:CAMPEP_0181214234 /NCGR_PEP_ID=MMETSP1096-20121128/25338_1 /TAXON_ID=156174 ORGANISM="Chrysochromulina ericina, Strain CCMP281" /NCGR_SAMPLE_ID=MMETSP1096 /ASSEMBLY_ACC=CAM_ASM_000453 /LENGTH=148 /DNA_ID=CAMNT_0023305943 /DNA_START=272 /DNA_END=717 /DNA_ORIENTATION=+
MAWDDWFPPFAEATCTGAYTEAMCRANVPRQVKSCYHSVAPMCRASPPKVKSRYQVLAPPPRHHPADSAAGGAMAGATKVSRPCLLSAVVVAGQARVPPAPPAIRLHPDLKLIRRLRGPEEGEESGLTCPVGQGQAARVVIQWSPSGH